MKEWVVVARCATLTHEEAVRLDAGRLSVLFRRLGPVAAEAVVTRAMEQLALRLADLRPLMDEGRFDEMARRARGMVAIADQIGMASLARVARDVSSCAARVDTAALGATLARLERIADVSLMAIWDMHDPVV